MTRINESLKKILSFPLLLIKVLCQICTSLFCICTTRQWFWNIQYGVQGVTEAWMGSDLCGQTQILVFFTL